VLAISDILKPRFLEMIRGLELLESNRSCCSNSPGCLCKYQVSLTEMQILLEIKGPVCHVVVDKKESLAKDRNNPPPEIFRLHRRSEGDSS